MRRHAVGTALFAALFAGVVAPQVSEPESRESRPAATQPATKPATEPGDAPDLSKLSPKDLLQVLRDNGIDVDLVASTVTVEATAARPDQPLEYLLIHPRGKSHEALFIAEVLPSLLNAGLLAIGFEPGKNARAVEIEPAPTIEEVRAGAEWLEVFPPEGQQLWLTVSFEVDGKRREDWPVEDLLVDMTTGELVRDNQWIFLGGNFAPLLRGEPPVFVGDYQGNIVSTCYMHPPNHLVTMDHERANDEQNWWKTKTCPPYGTSVRVTFHRTKPPTVVAREKRIAEEDKRRGEEARAVERADGSKGRQNEHDRGTDEEQRSGGR